MIQCGVSPPELRFDNAAHRYWLASQELPSVTHVLEAERLLNFGGASAESMQYGRERGDAVHLATELYDLDDIDESTLDPVVLPYLNAWERFRVETGFVIDALEHFVYHATYRYAGRLDRFGRFKKGPAIVDIKTGQPQRATGYQLAAYDACLPKSEQRRKRFGCYLRDDGTYSLVEYADRGDLSVFLAALTLYNVRGKQ